MRKSATRDYTQRETEEEHKAKALLAHAIRLQTMALGLGEGDHVPVMGISVLRLDAILDDLDDDGEPIRTGHDYDLLFRALTALEADVEIVVRPRPTVPFALGEESQPVMTRTEIAESLRGRITVRIEE